MNYGTLFTAWGTAGILGPFMGGRVFDRFQGYRFAFYIAGALAVLAALSLGFARSGKASIARSKTPVEQMRSARLLSAKLAHTKPWPKRGVG